MHLNVMLLAGMRDAARRHRRRCVIFVSSENKRKQHDCHWQEQIEEKDEKHKKPAAAHR
jgi:hypothetical protein